MDFYLPDFLKSKLEQFLKNLEALGFTKLKFKQTKNAIFSKLEYSGAIVRFEAIAKKIKDYKTMPFETIDGHFMIVNILSPELLLKEKISSYLERQKIRDLYDIFFLLKFVKKNSQTKILLRNFLKKCSLPKDEKDLKALIISGAVPKSNDMLEEIKKWAK